MKRIRLTVEWDGACSEYDWARILSDDIEDDPGGSRVVEVEYLTNEGRTEAFSPVPSSDDPDPFLTPHEARKNKRLGRG